MLKKNFIFYVFYFLTFLSLGYGVILNDYRIMFISTFTLLLFLILELLKIKMSFFLKVSIYVFLFSSEILGEIFNFYSIASYWDNCLHFFSGIITSYIGFMIFNYFVKSNFKSRIWLCFIFVFCFSVTIGVMWEFIEFGFDRYLGSDMQKDTFINSFNTVSFDSIKHVDNIVKTDIVTYKGVISLNSGYLDIGLYDTIIDLFLNVIGALCASSVIVYCNKKV